MRLSSAIFVLAFCPAVFAMMPAQKHAAPARHSTLATQHQLAKEYDEISKAFRNGDIERMGSYMLPNYIAEGEHAQGGMNRDQIIADFTRQSKMLKDIDWKRNIRSVHQIGPKAVVLVDGQMTAAVPGKDGKPHQLKFHGVSEDTWIQGKTKWFLERSVVKSASMTMDGKPAGGMHRK